MTEPVKFTTDVVQHTGMHHHIACPVRSCTYTPDEWEHERPFGLNVDRLARALAIIGPADIEDSTVGWNAYAVDIGCAYGSTDSDEPAP